jgi:hypothetical protein
VLLSLDIKLAGCLRSATEQALPLRYKNQSDIHFQLNPSVQWQRNDVRHDAALYALLRPLKSISVCCPGRKARDLCTGLSRPNRPEMRGCAYILGHRFGEQQSKGIDRNSVQGMYST